MQVDRCYSMGSVVAQGGVFLCAGFSVEVHEESADEPSSANLSSALLLDCPKKCRVLAPRARPLNDLSLLMG